MKLISFYKIEFVLIMRLNVHVTRQTTQNKAEENRNKTQKNIITNEYG